MRTRKCKNGCHRVLMLWITMLSFILIAKAKGELNLPLFDSVSGWFQEEPDIPEEEPSAPAEDTGMSALGMIATLKTVSELGGGTMSSFILSLTEKHSLLQTFMDRFVQDKGLPDFIQDQIMPVVIGNLDKSDPIAKFLNKLMEEDHERNSKFKTFLHDLIDNDIVRSDLGNVVQEILSSVNDTGAGFESVFTAKNILPFLFKDRTNKTVPLQIFVPIAEAYFGQMNTSGFDVSAILNRFLNSGCPLKVGTLLKLVEPILDGSNIDLGVIDNALEVLMHKNSEIDLRCILDAVFNHNQNTTFMKYIVKEVMDNWLQPSSLANETRVYKTPSLFSKMGEVLTLITGDEFPNLRSIIPLIQNVLQGNQSIKSVALNVMLSVLIGNKRPSEMTPKCWDHIMLLKKGFVQQDMWALRMFDSWGKLRSGLFNGQLAFLGQYDMCLATHGRVQNVSLADHVEHVHGEYCKATLGVTYSPRGNKTKPYNFNIQLGVCVPEHCQNNDVDIILKRVLSRLDTEVKSVKCVQENEIYLSNDLAATITALFVSSWVFAIITFTCVDRLCCRRKRIKRSSSSVGAGISMTPTEVTLTELSVFGSTATTLTTLNGQTPPPPTPRRQLSSDSSAGSSSESAGSAGGDAGGDARAQDSLLAGAGNDVTASDNTVGDLRRRRYAARSQARRNNNGVFDANGMFGNDDDDSDDSDDLTYSLKDEQTGAKVKVVVVNDDQPDAEVTCTPIPVVDIVTEKAASRCGGCSKQARLFIYAVSLTSNLKRLLSTHTSVGPTSCVHGLRVISLIWLVQYSMGDYAFDPELSQNVGELLVQARQLPAQIVMSGVLAIDTLFFVSGLVVSYLFMAQLSRFTGFRSKWQAYLQATAVHVIHGIIKFTPLYVLVLVTFTYLVPYWGSGPIWTTNDHKYLETCRKSWIHNAFHLNNILSNDKDSMCMPWTWYLATDFQYYLFAPALILVLTCIPWLGVLLITVLSLGSIAVIGAIYAKVYPVQFLDDVFDGDFGSIYIKPWCRFGPYGVGMLLGYLISRRGSEIRINKWTAALGWFLCTILSAALLFASYDRHCSGCSRWGLAASLAWHSSRHVLWSLCMAWITLACYADCGGIVNSVLSWRALMPLSRLVKSTYLLHPIVMYLIFMNRRQTIFFEGNTQIIVSSGFVAVSFVTSGLLALLVEWPLLQLEHVTYRHFRRRKQRLVKRAKASDHH